MRALRTTGPLTPAPGVTFLVGENGSGKSTLVEAVATAVGLNAEGGSRSFRFATRASESALGEYLQIDDTGELHQVAHDDARRVVLTRAFLGDPQRFLRLLAGP